MVCLPAELFRQPFLEFLHIGSAHDDTFGNGDREIDHDTVSEPGC